MAAKASVSWEWRWRLALIALMGIGWGVYSLYDGLVAYPKHNQIRAEWDRLEAEGRKDEWERYAAERGWSTEQPDPPKSSTSINAQFFMAALTLPIGLVFGFHFVRSLSKWIATDEKGLHTSGGDHAPFASIQNLNKDRWKSKGIAIVTYQGDKGLGKIVLDDWKFTTAPIRQMVRDIEEHLRPEQITGGAPEAVAEAQANDATASADPPAKPADQAAASDTKPDA